MPTFTPPVISIKQGDDILLGRYKAYWGQSVVKKNGHYVTQPYPWLGDLRPYTGHNDAYGTELVEGVDWFQGGRTYIVSPTIAAALSADGFTTS